MLLFQCLFFGCYIRVLGVYLPNVPRTRLPTLCGLHRGHPRRQALKLSAFRCEKRGTLHSNKSNDDYIINDWHDYLNLYLSFFPTSWGTRHATSENHFGVLRNIFGRQALQADGRYRLEIFDDGIARASPPKRVPWIFDSFAMTPSSPRRWCSMASCGLEQSSFPDKSFESTSLPCPSENFLSPSVPTHPPPSPLNACEASLDLRPRQPRRRPCTMESLRAAGDLSAAWLCGEGRQKLRPLRDAGSWWRCTTETGRTSQPGCFS